MTGTTIKISDFVSVPYKLTVAKHVQNLTGKVKRLPLTVRELGGLANSYSKGAGLKMSYHDLSVRLRCSVSTIARAVSTLKDFDLVSQKKGKVCATYTVAFKAGRGFYRVEDWLSDYVSAALGRKLTRAERHIYAFILSRCESKKGQIDLSLNEIVAEVGVSLTTVKTALKALYRARMLFRSNVGNSLRRKSTYNVSMEIVRSNRKIFKQKKEKIPEEVIDANARADRERYFARKRAHAEQIVERNREIMSRDELYKTAERVYNNSAREWAKLSIAADNGDQSARLRLVEVEDVQARAEKQMKARLSSFNLSMKDLQPRYECAECSDSGYLPNGRACGCYKRE